MYLYFVSLLQEAGTQDFNSFDSALLPVILFCITNYKESDKTQKAMKVATFQPSYFKRK